MNPPGPGFADAARDLPSVKNGMAECEAGARVLKRVTGMNPFFYFPEKYRSISANSGGL